MLLLSRIATYCKAQKLGTAQDTLISNIQTDSRQITVATTCLFVAIATNHRDGHLHIADAYQKGVRAFLVTDSSYYSQFPDALFLLVTNTVQALQLLATSVRKQYDIPVIGITGSNGKTMVKEWLLQLLQANYNIVCNPKSYNSQIGVPLSVWRMNETHELGIFEAGISEPNEMDLLEKIIQPSIGIFTNIGEAHNQGFVHKRQKINEKLQLFKHAGWLIYSKDNHELHEAIIQFRQNLKSNSGAPLQLFDWSYKQNASLQILATEKTLNKTTLTGIYQGKTCQIQIPFTDAASIENAVNCWCIMLLLKVDTAQIELRMAALQPIAMRLELRQGENDCIIINDAYNSDITSLHIALDLLDQQKQQVSKTVILSDLQQTGRADLPLYTEVAQILKKRGIHKFIGVGTALSQYRQLFEADHEMTCYFFNDTQALLQQIYHIPFEKEAILLKAARSFAFEKVSLLLEQKIHQTVMSVNLSALRNNLDTFRRRLKPQVKTMAMVKAASYGSGSYEIAETLQAAKVDYLTVAYVDEGVLLRKAKISLPIMVMSPSTESFDRMIVWQLEPEIFNIRSLRQFIAVAKNMNVSQYPIHIKLDTGMHRLGFAADEMPELLALIKDETCLKVASIFSHLAAADDKSFAAFTHQQASQFIEMSQMLIEVLTYRPLLHLCNTAGIVQYPEYHFDMVRLGLGLYGIDSSASLNNQLQQISTLRTTIAQIKKITAGDTIGYSRKGKAEKDLLIATICIGYADGYTRSLSHSDAYVIINNKAAKLIGNIAMDMCMVDISDIEGVAEGDEVIVFGDALPIQQLATWANTIPYEIMTSIAQRVKRVYVNESKATE